jgi:hypothetical protein
MNINFESFLKEKTIKIENIVIYGLVEKGSLFSVIIFEHCFLIFYHDIEFQNDIVITKYKDRSKVIMNGVFIKHLCFSFPLKSRF